MRFLLKLVLALGVALSAWSAVSAESGAELGVEAERIARPSALEDGYGAVVISIRSELYLDEPLHVFFLREGGDPSNPRDVIRFERHQGLLSFGNDTVKYKVRAYQLPAGTYRLLAHGMECDTIPAEDERCLIEYRDFLGSEEISRPSRGYGEIAPKFEVVAGSVTYAGDFGLTARNTIEWAEIPSDKMGRVGSRFAAMPKADEPIIPGEFRMKYGLRARSYEDDAGRRF